MSSDFPAGRNLPCWRSIPRDPRRSMWGSAQIGVEIQHKDRLLTDPGTIEDVRAVENDVVPFESG